MRFDQATSDIPVELFTMASEMELELTKNIIPFWLAQKDERGGFFSFADQANNRDSQAIKGCLLNSRILWFFSRSASELTDPVVATECRQAARHAFRFMKNSLMDSDFGGVYWSVDCEGVPMDTQKHIYCQAFAIYALSEWYALTHDSEALRMIEQLYSLIELHAKDAVHKGYYEAFNREWESIGNDLICDSEDVVSDKSMNTHLHILEAYSRYFDINPNPELKERIIELIGLLCNETQNHHFSFDQFFTSDWRVQSKNHSYGHDIEGSWLIWEAAEKVITGDQLAIIKDRVLAMADRVKAYGTDVDGAINHEWIDEKFIDTTRVWWVQAEAIVGFLNAWQLTGRSGYLNAAQQPWLIIRNSIVDHVHGEWHQEVDRWGRPNLSAPKVSPWKCPYHNGRACLEVMSRVQADT